MPTDIARNGPVSVLVFDVNETLLDLTTLEPLFERVFSDREVMREWFAQLILYSQTMTLSGIYAPFGALAVGALNMIAGNRGVAIADADIDELKECLGTMQALPDVKPALARLQKTGFRMVTLTNSPPSASPTPLERAGIAGFFEQSFSVDAVQKFKPAPETYQLVAQTLGVQMSEMCLIACHLWDTIGAQAAGCRGALVLRPNNGVLPAAGVPVPDLIAADMAVLADEVIGRWQPGPGHNQKDRFV